MCNFNPNPQQSHQLFINRQAILQMIQNTSNYVSYSYESPSSHYRGVDTSPDTLAKNDPDWYYDHYEHGKNTDVDDYLESEGYD
ncbi:MAG: hypothetical protein V8S94_01885 [Methanobrevibacter smithii]